MFRKIFTQALAYLWPPRLLSGLGRILTTWQGSDAREKGVLLLVFAPMMICLLGLLFSVVSFVLFVLPAFVLRLLGWGMLAALFGGGGVYCHDRLKGHNSSRRMNSSFYDVTVEPSDPDASAQEEPLSPKQDGPERVESPSWFENVRWMRWKE